MQIDFHSLLIYITITTLQFRHCVLTSSTRSNRESKEGRKIYYHISSFHGFEGEMEFSHLSDSTHIETFFAFLSFFFNIFDPNIDFSMFCVLCVCVYFCRYTFSSSCLEEKDFKLKNFPGEVEGRRRRWWSKGW